MGGIKLHAAIDVLIKNNRIHNAGRGMWMDWMAQGTRITGNLCYDNTTDDLFVEVDHGPFLVDNNLLLSAVSLSDMSEGGAYVHNLMTGRISSRPEPRRSTPYHQAHSTALAGLADVKGGDDRFYNNILVGDGNASADAAKPPGKGPQRAAPYGLWVYDGREFPLQTGGNVFYNGARPYCKEANHLVQAGFDPKVRVEEKGGEVFLHLTLGQDLRNPDTTLVTTELLGKAKVSGLPYENPDGSPLKIDTDYFGKPRSPAHPTPGPFENPGAGPLSLKVW
jgi:hypothetical protein